LIFRISFPSEL